MSNYVDLIAEVNPEAYVMDGYDNCIIGISSSGNLVYSRRLIIVTLMGNDGMTMEDALEWYSHNMVRSLDYLGTNAPVFCEEDAEASGELG